MSATSTAPVNALSNLAGRIAEEHRRVEGGANKAEHHARRAGKLLIEAKELLPHGEFASWLVRHFPASKRTAQLYMRLARDPKSATLALSVRGEEEAGRERVNRTPATAAISAISQTIRAIERMTGDDIYQPSEAERKKVVEGIASLRQIIAKAEAYSRGWSVVAGE